MMINMSTFLQRSRAIEAPASIILLAFLEISMKQWKKRAHLIGNAPTRATHAILRINTMQSKQLNYRIMYVPIAAVVRTERTWHKTVLRWKMSSATNGKSVQTMSMKLNLAVPLLIGCAIRSEFAISIVKVTNCTNPLLPRIIPTELVLLRLLSATTNMRSVQPKQPNTNQSH
jgi:hypothetical protein